MAFPEPVAAVVSTFFVVVRSIPCRMQSHFYHRNRRTKLVLVMCIPEQRILKLSLPSMSALDADPPDC